MLVDSEPNLPPLIKHFTEKFKQPLDIIRNLGDVDVVDRNYSLPKIIVVGDASVGKTSLISTLVGLNLPRGLQIPFVLKFEIHSSPYTKLYLRYQYQLDFVNVEVSEADLGSKVLAAAKLLTENKASITLIVMQPHVSNLTVVDLPGIHANSDKDQLKKEFQVLNGYISEHIQYKECVFINVIPASGDLKSCKSTKVLKEFDFTGTQTVSVITKIDLCSAKMLAQLTLNDISHLFGYALVKNVTGDGTTENNNYYLFNNSILSGLDKKHFGFEIAAQSIIQVMLSILFNPRSPIVKKLDIDLKESLIKRNDKSNSTFTFMSNVSSAQHTLYKLFISEDYSQYHEEDMHAYARLSEILDKFYSTLQELNVNKESNFLEDEIELLDTHKGIHASFFNSPIRKQFLNASETIIDRFITHVWGYIKVVVLKVLLDHAKHYDQQLNLSLKTARKMIEKTKTSFKKKVAELLELENMFFHTSNPDAIVLRDKYNLGDLKVTNVEREVFPL